MERVDAEFAMWRGVPLLAALVVVAACSDSPGDGPGGSRMRGRTGLATTGGNAGSPGGPGTDLGGDLNSDFDPMSIPQMPLVDEDRCTSTDIRTERTTPVVMLVLDGSLSMADPYGDPPAADAGPDGGMADANQQQQQQQPAPAGTTRWQAMRDAIVGPDGVVPALQDLVKFGLAVYGTQPACPLPLGVVDPVLNNYDDVAAGLGAQPPGMYTPTGVALDQVVDMLPDPTMAPPDQSIEPQIIVLATDGDPNDCMPADIFAEPQTNTGPSINAALKAKSKNLKMYVVSLGTDASEAHLQELANIGAGKDQFASDPAPVYYPEDPASLASTLSDLIGAELSCDVKLSGQGVREGAECNGSEVLLDGQPLVCGEDWELVDSFHIRLKGQACETFKASASAVLNASFPCETLLDNG